MDLEAAVNSQIGSQRPEEVDELVLDTCKATKVTGLDKFTNLRYLTLNGCGLTTLEGFPCLQKLKTLELADNQLNDGLEALQDAALVYLTRLSLAGNRFSSLESLEPLVRAASHAVASAAASAETPWQSDSPLRASAARPGRRVRCRGCATWIFSIARSPRSTITGRVYSICCQA